MRSRQSLGARLVGLLREIDRGLTVMHDLRDPGSWHGLDRQQQPWATGEDVWQPDAEVVPTAEAGVTARLALPGVSPDDMDVSVQRRTVVVVSGVSGGAAFHREVVLPIGLDPHRAGATMRDGLLRVTVPADEQVQQRDVDRLRVDPS